MGLDMYAYVASKAGQQDEFYEGAEWDTFEKESVNHKVTKPREIAYWRKHPSLHGYMEQLWERKMQQEGRDDPRTFNGIELELSWDDINELEKTIKAKKLPFTRGFFFGEPADDFYYDNDLKFCINAKTELFLGLKVFYNSSW